MREQNASSSPCLSTRLVRGKSRLLNKPRVYREKEFVSRARGCLINFRERAREWENNRLYRGGITSGESGAEICVFACVGREVGAGD